MIGIRRKRIYKGRTQKEDVFLALEKLGGRAYYYEIYSELADTWREKYGFDLDEREPSGQVKWKHSIQGALGSLKYDGLVEYIRTNGRGYWKIIGGRGGYITQREDYNFSDKSYEFFYDVISSAERSVKILTFVLSFKGIEKIFQGIKPIESVSIVTNRLRDISRIKQFLADKGIQSVEIKRCKNLHAKICIVDDKKVIVGSSNLTAKSLGLSSNPNIEANILTENSNVVKKASNIFDYIINSGNVRLITETYEDEDIISSIPSSGIPSRIMNLIKESDEILMILPSMIERHMFGIFKMINDSAKIKILIHWPRSSLKRFKKGLKALRAMKSKNAISLIPVKENIHAKVYVFNKNGSKIALISSLNMTEPSWDYYIEAGLLTKNDAIIKDIENKELEFHRVVMEDPDDKVSNGGGSGGEVEEIDELHESNVEGQNYINYFSELLEKFKSKYPYVYEENDEDTDIIGRTMPFNIFLKQIDEVSEDEGFTNDYEIPLENDKNAKVREINEKESSTEEPKQKIDNMVYLYCALLLHYGKKPITKDRIIKILNELDITYDPIIIDALISSLKNVNINNALGNKKVK